MILPFQSPEYDQLLCQVNFWPVLAAESAFLVGFDPSIEG
jgi:hypothetical protein